MARKSGVTTAATVYGALDSIERVLSVVEHDDESEKEGLVYGLVESCNKVTCSLMQDKKVVKLYDDWLPVSAVIVSWATLTSLPQLEETVIILAERFRRQALQPVREYKQVFTA